MRLPPLPSLASVAVLVIVVVALLSGGGGGDGSADGDAPAGPVRAPVVRGVDGDTIVVRLDGAEEDVRFIGVDTPESVKPDTPVQC